MTEQQGLICLIECEEYTIACEGKWEESVVCKKCGCPITSKEIMQMLNEYETLKKRLSVIYDSIDDYLAPVTVKGTTKDKYVSVEASTLAWWMDTIEDILEGKDEQTS